MVADGHESDLRPWDQALAQRVQPLLSALFHDLMTPLAIVDSNLYLAERYAEMLIDAGDLDEDTVARLRAIVEVVGIAKAAAKRVTAGLKLSRDEIWRTALEGTALDVIQIKEAIREVTTTPRTG